MFPGILLVVLTFSIPTQALKKKSCRDFLYQNENVKSGEFKVYNKLGEKYTVFCEFHGYHGYMFIPHDTRAAIFMSDLKPRLSHVLVRHLRTDGRQYDTRMEQISAYWYTPLSIQYNQSLGYKAPVNRAAKGPYLYLGFLPKRISASKGTQGYRANGKDFTFRNCNTDPNSYLVFYFNHGYKKPSGYYKRCCYSGLMRNWINAARPTHSYLPWTYFFSFEMHMGGCGGYAINGYRSLTDIVGAALGIPFCKYCGIPKQNNSKQTTHSK